MTINKIEEEKLGKALKIQVTGFTGYLTAILGQQLVGKGLSLVSPAVMLSRKDAHQLYAHITPKRVRRELEALTDVERALEMFANRSNNGDVAAFGKLLYIATRAIAYLDKVAYEKPELAEVFAVDCTSWPVRLPYASARGTTSEQRKLIDDRLCEIGVGKRLEAQDLTLGDGRIGMIGYLLPRYMAMLRNLEIDTKGIAFATECRNLNPLTEETLEDWWTIARKILHASYDGFVELGFPEIITKQGIESESDIKARFIDRVSRKFKELAYAAASVGQSIDYLPDVSQPINEGKLGAFGSGLKLGMLHEKNHDEFVFVASDLILPYKIIKELTNHDPISDSLQKGYPLEVKKILNIVKSNGARETLVKELLLFLNKALSSELIRLPKGLKIISPETRALIESFVHEQWDSVDVKEQRKRLIEVNQGILEDRFSPYLTRKHK